MVTTVSDGQVRVLYTFQRTPLALPLQRASSILERAREVMARFRLTCFLLVLVSLALYMIWHSLLETLHPIHANPMSQTSLDFTHNLFLCGLLPCSERVVLCLDKSMLL